jgi:hypothetical protein
LAFETKASMGNNIFGELPIELTTFVPGKCEYGGESCSVTTTYPEPAGTLTWNGGESKNGHFGKELHQAWFFKCGSPLGSTLTCQMGYDGSGSVELLGSSENPTIGFYELQLLHYSGGCPEITRLAAEYHVTSQIPLYVTY